MNETELRKHRCCFTGHRPEKLNIPEKRLALLLEEEIKKAIVCGFTTYITGMAKGTLSLAKSYYTSGSRTTGSNLSALYPTQASACTGAAVGQNALVESWRQRTW